MYGNIHGDALFMRRARTPMTRSPRSLIDFLDSASFQTDSQIVAIDRLESRFLQILNTDIIDAVIQYSVIHSIVIANGR